MNKNLNLNLNYSNTTERSPFKKGKLSDIVHPKARFIRVGQRNDDSVVLEMKADLVRALADLGIVIQNTYTLARCLVNSGWVKTKQIKKDI